MVGQRQATSTVFRQKVTSSQPAPRSSFKQTNLLESLAAALQSDAPLNYFVETLGTQLLADACLLLGYHPGTGHLLVSRWAAGWSTQQWQLSAAMPTESAQQQYQLALTLLRSLQDNAHNWFSTGKQLFSRLQDDGWWQLESQQMIPIYAMPTVEGVIVLMRRQGTVALLPPDFARELASLGALALHQHDLQQQFQRSIEQLRYLNHLKDDFLSTLSHELRTPLTSMMLAIRMLRRSDLTPERQAMYLDILEQQCAQETALVNDLLTLRSLETGSESISVTVIDLNQFSRQIVASQQAQFEAANLNLIFEPLGGQIYLESDASGLTRILEELLTNARKYSEANTDVRLSLDCETANEVTMRLTNVGHGISPEELPYVFDKFRRGQGMTQKAIPGTGTGLALVKGLVSRLKGEISVSSQPQAEGSLRETTFTLRLAGSAVAKVG